MGAKSPTLFREKLQERQKKYIAGLQAIITAQTFECFVDLIFNGFHRYAKLRSYLSMTQTIALTHQKNLAATIGQGVDGMPQTRVALRCVDIIVGDIAFLGERLMPANFYKALETGVSDRFIEISLEVCKFRPVNRHLMPHLGKHFLNDIFGLVDVAKDAERIHGRMVKKLCLPI